MTYCDPPFFRLSTFAPTTLRWDWSAWLGQDRITDVVFTAEPEGLTLSNPESTDGLTASVDVAGGTEGETFRVACQIETIGNRIDVRTLTLLAHGSGAHSGPQTYPIPQDPSINCSTR
jgi:hypothetical protein